MFPVYGTYAVRAVQFRTETINHCRQLHLQQLAIFRWKVHAVISNIRSKMKRGPPRVFLYAQWGRNSCNPGKTVKVRAGTGWIRLPLYIPPLTWRHDREHLQQGPFRDQLVTMVCREETLVSLCPLCLDRLLMTQRLQMPDLPGLSKFFVQDHPASPPLMCERGLRNRDVSV